MDAHLIVWRHPRPVDAAGRCIGRTDLAVDRRKAKRLAHRIRRAARRETWPRVVWTSPLRRSADVGRWLARWGWRHRIDARLAEFDFGEWDGLRWRDMAAHDIEEWTRNFADHAPGRGESVWQLMARCREFIAAHDGFVCVVGHAGWVNAMRWVAEGRSEPGPADQWPAPLRYGASERFFSNSGGAESQ